jgi:hypothetical protein
LSTKLNKIKDADTEGNNNCARLTDLITSLR